MLLRAARSAGRRLRRAAARRASPTTGPGASTRSRHPSRPLYFQVADPLDERRQALNRTLLGLIVPLVRGAAAAGAAAAQYRPARAARAQAARVARSRGAAAATCAPIGLAGPAARAAARWATTSTGCSSAWRMRSTSSARWRPTPRTSCARRWRRCGCGCRPPSSRTCGATTCRRRSTRCSRFGHRTEKLLQLSRAESGASLARTPVDLLQLAGHGGRRSTGRTSRLRQRLDLQMPESGRAAGAAATSTRWRSRCATWSRTRCKYGGDGRVEVEVGARCALVVRDVGPGVRARAAARRCRSATCARAADRRRLRPRPVDRRDHRRQARRAAASWPRRRPGASRGFEARIELDR